MQPLVLKESMEHIVRYFPRENIREDSGWPAVLFIERVSLCFFSPMALAKVIYVSNARIDGLRMIVARLPDGAWNLSTLLKPVGENRK